MSWRAARAAESARLESVCGATHRGFESHALRQTSGGQGSARTPCLPELSPRTLAAPLPWGMDIRQIRPTDHEDAAMVTAIAEARLAVSHGDVPVGALVLIDGEIVAQRHNERELTSDPCAHAEILALRDAAKSTGSWRLDSATIVVTLEPCAMCAGAIVNARVQRLVFGATDAKAGATGSLYNLCADPRLNHEVEVVALVRASECATLLTEFFALRRTPSTG